MTPEISRILSCVRYHSLSFCINCSVQFLYITPLTGLLPYIERFGYKSDDIVMLTDDAQNPRQQPTKDNIVRV
jgi:hypothetical protein